ncbi:MAG TPA: erythromycin esterase family protein [Thermoanaerobaculia bacterium]
MPRFFAALLLLLTTNAFAQSQAEIDSVRNAAHPLTGAASDYDALLTAAGERRIVLLGEASHGTSEFYRERARITRRLIEEKRFRAIVLEANWSDVARVDAYIRGAADGDPLAGFTEFPVWMWRNAEFAALVRWLREFNRALPPNEPQVRIYGLDLYATVESIDALIAYLRETDLAAAQRAEQRYACFASYRNDFNDYARALQQSSRRSCQQQAAEQLEEMEARYAASNRRDDRLFAALQDARVVRSAEAFYRAAVTRGASTWNVRDTHMADTLDALIAHLDATDAPARVALWAHNTHVGDARATDKPLRGEISIGQLVRDRWPGQSLHVGFSMYGGTVLAADDWGFPGQVKTLRPAIVASDAALFHATGQRDFYVLTAEPSALAMERRQRAVGVVYRPNTELQSHYFWGIPVGQYDVMIHIDESHAVTPLNSWPMTARRRAVRSR